MSKLLYGIPPPEKVKSSINNPSTDDFLQCFSYHYIR